MPDRPRLHTEITGLNPLGSTDRQEMQHSAGPNRAARAHRLRSYQILSSVIDQRSSSEGDPAPNPPFPGLQPAARQAPSSLPEHCPSRRLLSVEGSAEISVCEREIEVRNVSFQAQGRYHHRKRRCNRIPYVMACSCRLLLGKSLRTPNSFPGY